MNVQYAKKKHKLSKIKFKKKSNIRSYNSFALSIYFYYFKINQILSWLTCVVRKANFHSCIDYILNDFCSLQIFLHLPSFFFNHWLFPLEISYIYLSFFHSFFLTLFNSRTSTKTLKKSAYIVMKRKKNMFQTKMYWKHSFIVNVVMLEKKDQSIFFWLFN